VLTERWLLVALACEEIVMPPDAVLGPANTDEPTVDDAMRAAGAGGPLYARPPARRGRYAA
jgi:hypothetical protein